MVAHAFLKMAILKPALAGAALVAMATPALANGPISGRWITQEKDAVISVTKCGASLCGRVVKFLKIPPDGVNQRDGNNPNPKLRTRKVMGMPILSGFKQDGKLWRGKIYDPNSGKTYRSIVRRKSATVLEVKGCVGPFCQTQLWRKAR